MRSLVKNRHRGSACSGFGDRDVGPADSEPSGVLGRVGVPDGVVDVDGSVGVGVVAAGGAAALDEPALLGGAPVPGADGEQPARPITAKEVIMIPAVTRPQPSDMAPTAGSVDHPPAHRRPPTSSTPGRGASDGRDDQLGLGRHGACRVFRLSVEWDKHIVDVHPI